MKQAKRRLAGLLRLALHMSAALKKITTILPLLKHDAAAVAVHKTWECWEVRQTVFNDSHSNFSGSFGILPCANAQFSKEEALA